MMLTMLMGCDKLEDRVKTNSRILPPGATNVEYLKDEKGIKSQWGKFTLEGKTVYFSDAGDGYQYIELGNSTTEKASENLPTINGQPQIECPHCHARIVITPLGPVHLKE